MLRAPGATVHRARRLRKDLSAAELRLWLVLRARPGGLKFRKQHPAGPFVPDFSCAAARLGVEMDDNAHSRGAQPAFDGWRDARLRFHDVDTVRVTANDVFRDIDVVATPILEAARLRLPLHQPAAGPPPCSGEERTI